MRYYIAHIQYQTFHTISWYQTQFVLSYHTVIKMSKTLNEYYIKWEWLQRNLKSRKTTNWYLFTRRYNHLNQMGKTKEWRSTSGDQKITRNGNNLKNGLGAETFYLPPICTISNKRFSLLLIHCSDDKVSRIMECILNYQETFSCLIHCWTKTHSHSFAASRIKFAALNKIEFKQEKQWSRAYMQQNAHLFFSTQRWICLGNVQALAPSLLMFVGNGKTME